jgi:hypothetical protein
MRLPPPHEPVVLAAMLLFTHMKTWNEWNLQTLSGGPGPRQVATIFTQATRGKARGCRVLLARDAAIGVGDLAVTLPHHGVGHNVGK